MGLAYLVVTIVASAMTAFSGFGKLRPSPKIVHIVHQVIGVPLKYFLHLAACEFAGSVGLVLGIWWPFLGIAAGLGLVVYFVAAIVSHLRVGDVEGIAPAVFMVVVAAGTLVLRILTICLVAELPLSAR